MAMSKEYAFIYEQTHYRRTLIILITFAVIFALFLLFLTYKAQLYDEIKSIPVIGYIVNSLEEDITELNVGGIFYITFLADLFFNPIPPELFLYGALNRGVSPALLFIASIAGLFLAHIANYVIGRRFSVFFIHFASKKGLYKIRRKVNRYGAYAVFIFNLLPLPAPLLTFALGITRYNYYRLFSLLLLGNVIKYAILILSYLYFSFLLLNNLLLLLFPVLAPLEAILPHSVLQLSCIG